MQVPRAEPPIARLIVKLRNPSELAQPMSASRMQALTATAGVGMKSVRAMSGGASLVALDAAVPLSDAKNIAARLALNPAVEYAEPDIMLKRLATPSEVRFAEWQWNLFAPTATYAGVAPGTVLNPPTVTTGGANLQLAWDVTTGASNAVVAIIDTGITNHPDLNGQPPGDMYVPGGRFLAGYDFISPNVGGFPANFVSNDGNGRDADPSDPGDWVTAADEAMDPSQCAQGDSSWHGTHVAGVVAATANNNVGIAGIGWNVRILPIRALGKCGGSLSDIAEAIQWAAGVSVPGVPNNPTPARVINLSLGSPPSATCSSPTMQNAVNAAIAAGSVVVAATGNDGATQLSSPANCNGVIAVTAHTINGENADYANIGSSTGGPQPTISAPGGGSPIVLGAGGPTDNTNFYGFYIWSTIQFGSTSPTSSDSSNPPRSGPAYTGVVGTSAATPQVAGVAALIKSMIPGATPTQIRNFIVNNARPHPTGGACATAGQFAGQCSAGLLDANAAVRAAATTAPPIILAQPQNATAFEGQSATFAIEVTGAGPISYQWHRNGTAISGATAASYTTPQLTIAADNGAAFSVVATNTLGTATSTAATLTVTAPPPAAPTGGSPPPSGSGGGGGASPLWQVMLLFALSLAATIHRREAGQ